MTISTLPDGLIRYRRGEEEPQRIRPLDFRIMRRLLAYTGPYRRLRNGLLAMVIIRSLQLPALTWLTAAIINGPIRSRDAVGIWFGAGAFAILAIATQWVMHYRQRWAFDLGEFVVRDIRTHVFQHLQKMDLQWHQRTRVGQVISRLVTDVEDIRTGVQDVFFVSLVQLGQMTLAGLCMAWCDLRLFLWTLSIVPILAWINGRFHRTLSRAMRDMRDSYSRVTATLVETISGIRTTQSFARESRNRDAFFDLAADHSRYNTAVMTTQGFYVPLIDAIGQLTLAILLMVGGSAILRNPDITIEELVTFFLMAGLFFSPVSILANQYQQALNSMTGAERVFEWLDLPLPFESTAAAQISMQHRSLIGDVEFRGVSFAYHPLHPVLQGINIRASAGEMIALVGATGSGKSTLISLLARFLNPLSGQILLDGHDIQSFSAESLRSQVGLVLQHNHLFQGTVRDNIRFGRLTATDEEIDDVLQQLGASELFNELPQGLATPVGERGSQLSAGQRQLICFARALLLDPRILILDEATSALDPCTEAKLQSALSELMKSRTTFVVAHRLSTIERATTIHVLEGGKIVQGGSHQQLIQRPGPYRALHAAMSSLLSSDRPEVPNRRAA